MLAVGGLDDAAKEEVDGWTEAVLVAVGVGGSGSSQQ